MFTLYNDSKRVDCRASQLLSRKFKQKHGKDGNSKLFLERQASPMEITENQFFNGHPAAARLQHCF